jgi:hypothetical protein
MRFLDRAKFWLLDLVAVGHFPIRILIHNELTIVVNRATGHGLDHTELVKTLLSLFAEEMLVAKLWKKSSNGEYSQEIIPTNQNIEDALAGKLDIHYGLSPKGGEEWEKLAKPNWNWFINGYHPRGSLDLAGIDRRTLEKYLELKPYFADEEVVSGTEIWESLVPWHATSWKTLPSGWQVTCKVRSTDKHLGENIPLEYEEWLGKIQNWYINPIDQWKNLDRSADWYPI